MLDIGKPTQTLPNVAVCFAAYNGMLYLSEQIDSILAQTGVNIVVFVSIDTSSDGTEAWFDERAQEDGRIVVLSHGGKFGGAAQNFFRILREVDFTPFDYISFSDQDDVWLPSKLSRAHEVLMSAGADAYSSNVIAFWPDGRKILIEKSQPQVQWDFLFESAGPGCTYVLKKDLFFAIQDNLKEHWGDLQQVGQGQHDWFFYAFARANGYHWVIDDYAGMFYRQHKKNLVGVNLGWRAFIYRTRKVLSGWGIMQAALMVRLVGLNRNSFTIRWSDGRRMGLLWLSLHAWQCRRRFRDKWLFAAACLMLVVIGSAAKLNNND